MLLNYFFNLFIALFLNSGEDGYRSAALNQLNQVSGLTILTGNDSAFVFHSLDGVKEDSLMAPFIQLIDGHMTRIFFAFDDANKGGLSYFRNL